MKKILLTKLLPIGILLFAVVGLTLGLAGCGKDDSGEEKKDSNPTVLPETPGETGRTSDHEGTPLSCNEIWQGYVESNPVGRKEVYEDRTESKMGDQIVSSATLTRTREVVESNLDQVVERVLISTSRIPTTTTLTRAQFGKFCAAGFSGRVPSESEVSGTILETRQERIRVQAGEFDCRYQKLKTTSAGQHGLMELWTTGDGAENFIVKSVMETTIEHSGVKMVTIVSSELISRN